MTENIFYAYHHLRHGTSDIKIDVSKDIVFASLWLGSVMKPIIQLPSATLNLARIKKGVKVLKSEENVSRLVWLKGKAFKEMYETLKPLKMNNIVESFEAPDYILLKLKDHYRVIDHMGYLSELEGTIYDLNHRGLVYYHNSKRTRLHSYNTLDLYKLLSNIPDLNYEEFRRIQLIKDLDENTLNEVINYLHSNLITTTLAIKEDFRFRGEKSTKQIFEKILETNPISRIHNMSFQVARLLAS